MSPSGMRRDQRSVLNASTVWPSATMLRRGLRKPRRLSTRRRPRSTALFAACCSLMSSGVVTVRPLSYSALAPYLASRYLRTSSRKYGATLPSPAGSPPTTHRLFLGGLRGLARDEPFDGHPLERVVAAALGRFRIHERALAHVALDDAGDRRRLFEIQVLGALAEIQLRRGLDAVGAVSEVDLVAIEGEDLFLRVALLDADRDQRFLDLPLPAAIADGEADLGGEQVARQLLRDGAAAGRLAARGDVAKQRQHHSRDAEARMLEEARVLRGQDRLAEVLRNVVVMNDDAALDRELANELAILPEHARDRVG